MIAEVLEGVHHLDTAYAAFYTAMTSENDRVSNSFVRIQSQNYYYHHSLCVHVCSIPHS